MILAAALLVLASTEQAPTIESCSAQARNLIAKLEPVWKIWARGAELSPAGEAAIVALQREQGIKVWCEAPRPASDLARERLLSVFAADEVDEAALAGAREDELAAILQGETTELDGLIRIMRRLSADDRRKFAAWLREDLRTSWTKRERDARAK